MCQSARHELIESFRTSELFPTINPWQATSAFISWNAKKARLRTLSFWENMDVIKGFAGDDVELAKYYPEDKDFLIEFEPTVVHYNVVGHS